MDDRPDDLSRKIKEARAREELETAAQAPKAPVTGNSAGAGMAMRAATELVAALCVGGFIGFSFDRHLHTKPWGMIIMLFLGFFAGFLNIYRAQMGQDFKIGFGRKETKDKNGSQSP